ncbi:hypothetical protein LTR28_006327 [Elasticomyces elasticus]|nr:hypothetical protein LTR28_006327 [Elasticomyces elasticus]
MRNQDEGRKDNRRTTSTPTPRQMSRLPTPLPSPPLSSGGYLPAECSVTEWVEIYDYAGGVRFRGFVTRKGVEVTLFIFFDQGVIGKDLKHGLMALLELSGSSDFDCSRLVVCLDRSSDTEDLKDLTRDLGWVGFELTTLEDWAGQKNCISDTWLFLAIDV